MLKSILLFVAALFVLALGAYFFYISDAPAFPEGAEKAIEEALNEPLPVLETGKTGFADNDGVSIWYEVKQPETDSIKGTVLLVMGYASSAMVWPERFWQPLLNEGYQVIRYDNRGLGRSDWMKGWTQETAYSLEDMAKDGIAILDKEQIEKAHIIGASMGGMIAQRMAISHSDRVASLTSIMSTGYMLDPEIGEVPEFFQKGLTKLALKYAWNGSDEGMAKMGVCIPNMLRGSGNYTNNYKAIAQRSLYEVNKRKGFNTKVGDQHGMAILKSGSRLEELTKLSVPTLVVHGTDDPLVIPAHGKKYAPLIPNAEILWIEGMGHDLPQPYMARIHEACFRAFDKGNAKDLPLADMEGE